MSKERSMQPVDDSSEKRKIAPKRQLADLEDTLISTQDQELLRRAESILTHAIEMYPQYEEYKSLRTVVRVLLAISAAVFAYSQSSSLIGFESLVPEELLLPALMIMSTILALTSLLFAIKRSDIQKNLTALRYKAKAIGVYIEQKDGSALLEKLYEINTLRETIGDPELPWVVSKKVGSKVLSKLVRTQEESRAFFEKNPMRVSNEEVNDEIEQMIDDMQNMLQEPDEDQKPQKRRK